MTTEHEQLADQASTTIRVAVLTVSDTRTIETDTSGATIVELLKADGFEVESREVIPDDSNAIRAAINHRSASQDVDVLIMTGGTGIAKRDVTVETITPLLNPVLIGFGELFRMISYDEIGSAAMMSRAMAGIISAGTQHTSETLVFALPGSKNAVNTAMTKLILPQLRHLIWERRK